MKNITYRSVIIALVGTILICLSFAGTGCSRFGTVQVDKSYENGKLVRVIKTRVGANTVFDGKSELAKFSASQTDKTQSAKVGSLNNSSSSTNAIAALDKMIDLAKALPK
jgi:hypothetical protein